MIVDLMRNDLSSVCKPGSVTVDSLFKIKKYSTLTQLESTISGNLRHNVSLYKIFKTMKKPVVAPIPIMCKLIFQNIDIRLAREIRKRKLR